MKKRFPFKTTLPISIFDDNDKKSPTLVLDDEITRLVDVACLVKEDSSFSQFLVMRLVRIIMHTNIHEEATKFFDWAIRAWVMARLDHN